MSLPHLSTDRQIQKNAVPHTTYTILLCRHRKWRLSRAVVGRPTHKRAGRSKDSKINRHAETTYADKNRLVRSKSKNDWMPLLCDNPRPPILGYLLHSARGGCGGTKTAAPLTKSASPPPHSFPSHRILVAPAHTFVTCHIGRQLVT